MALLDIDSLTLAEIEAIEDATGMLIEELMVVAAGKTRPPTKVLRCLLWAMKHRTDPAFTMEMAKALTMDEMSAITTSEPSEGVKRKTKKPVVADPSGAATLNA